MLVAREAGNQDLLEQFYSGWFYVKGFTLRYSHENNTSIMTNFTQKFVLTRREWPPPLAVEAIQKTENDEAVL